MSKKEIAVKQETAPQVYSSDWQESEVLSQDILIPKILLMQSTSQFVQKDQSEVGFLVNSVTGEKLGSAKEKDFSPVNIIPVKIQNTWIEYEKLGEQLEYKGMVPRTKANENAPLEWKDESGIMHRRDKTIMLFCLLEKDLSEDFPMPYVIAFKRTSFTAGRFISTHFSKCDMARQMGKSIPPFAKTFKLSGEKKSNEKNTWYGFKFEAETSMTSEQGVTVASQWEKTLRSTTVKIDDSDEGGEAEVSQSSSSELDV